MVDDEEPINFEEDDAPAAPARGAAAGERPRELIDAALADKAAGILRAVAKGNGLMSNRIKATAVDGEVHNYEGLAYYKIEIKTGEKRVPGKMNGQVLGSQAELRAKIQGAIERATANPDVRKHTINVLKKRNDLGVAAENFFITHERQRQNFVVHEACTSCGKDGKVACSYCQAKGKVTCRRCHGTKEMVCPTCRGTMHVNGPQGQQPCQRCHGRGRARCTECQALGYEQCKPCKGTGQINCQNCNGTGWHSIVCVLDMKAKSHYDYDKSDMPPELPALIDALGPKLVTDKHAVARIIEEEERYRELAQVSKADEYIIPYHMRVPYAQIKFTIDGKAEIEGKMFGFNPRLSDLPAFLEAPLAGALTALAEAGNGAGNARLREAMRMRFVGETVLAVLRYPRKKALKMLVKRYPVGISLPRIQKAVLAADKALAHIIRGPRRWGLALGAVLAAGVYGAYFYAARLPLGAQPFAQNSRLLWAADALVLLAGAGIAAAAAHVVTTGSVRKALGKVAAKVPAAQLAVKPHITISLALLLALPLYLGAIEGTHMMRGVWPSWYQNARAKIIPATPAMPAGAPGFTMQDPAQANPQDNGQSPPAGRP